MTTYLSIDVATKSLAMGLYRVSSVLETENPSEDELDQIVIPIAVRVFDLNPKKSARAMTAEEKACALKSILTEFDTLIPPVQFTVLIEYQMSSNHLSNCIFNMLVYHYAGRAPIRTVYPAQKNSVWLHPNLKLSDFLALANNNYSANKNHCKYNFLYFMALFGHGHMLTNIKKKNLDDVADTFMQMLGYHKHQRKRNHPSA